MTVPVAATSVRALAARRFGVELTRAMKARGVGRRRLAERMGMSSASIIAHWRSGSGLPRLDSVVRLAECLDWDALVEIVRHARENHCDTCGTPFLNEGGKPKRYCSARCRAVKAKIRSCTPTRQRADLAERRLKEHIAAVAAMCCSCEPDGLCCREDCALRGVSPLPLRVEVRPEPQPATPAPGPYGSAENIARTKGAILASNAARWARPGERERFSALMVEEHQRRRFVRAGDALSLEPRERP